MLFCFNSLKQTQKKYDWTNPKTCDEALPKSVKLPKEDQLVDCPGCNPGFENNGTDCLLCKNNYYNEDGRGGINIYILGSV